MHRFRILAVALAFMVVATACSSDSDEEAATDDGAATSAAVTGDTDPAETDAGDAEASDDTEAAGDGEPIDVGVVVSDLARLRELDIVDLDRGDEELVWQTFFDEVNERGGINGRPMVMHWDPYLPTEQLSAEEACIRLTEDIGVFAVLGGIRGPAATANACFLDDHDTIMVGGTQTPELMASASAPWISNLMAADRRYTGGLDLMYDDGLLDGTVGLIYAAAEQDLYTDIVQPKLDELGVEVEVAVQDVAPNDTNAAQDAFGVIFERFDSVGVDTVLLVQSAMNIGSGFALDTGFDGQILTLDALGSTANLGRYDERDPAEFDGIIGVGGASDQEQWELPATQECVEIFEAANPDIDVQPSSEVPDGEPDYAEPVADACRHVRLFELVATAAGEPLTNDSFRAGLADVGPFELAGQPFNSLAADKFDADDSLRLVVFDSTIGEQGDVAPYTELSDIG